MSIVEIIGEYAEAGEGGEGGEARRPVLLLPGTRHLLDRVAGAVPHEPGDPTPDDGALLVGAAKAGKESVEVDAVATAVGERDILVLMLGSTPSALHVGPLVQALTAGGLRVVRAEQLEAPLTGTLLVACRGGTLPRTSYLLGEVIPDTDRANERLTNEWTIEGLQLRAIAASVAALQAAVDETTRIAGEQARAAEDASAAAHTQLATARAQLATVRAQLDALAKDNRELRAQAGRGPGWKVRRAVRLVKEDPLGGTKRLARSVARRAKR